jgi:phosphoribosylaminoimidazolecarboxamide formyltransferase / IMP cyclohydrolase
VACVTDPADYPAITAELKAGHGCVSLKTRYALARKAFAHVSDYDAAISRYLAALPFEKAAAGYTLENR